MRLPHWPVVARIPFRASVPDGVETRHWLPAGWSDGAASDSPLEIVHTTGPTTLGSHRPLLSSARGDTGDYFVDENGELAVIASDAPRQPAQLLLTLEAGHRYELRYADRSLIPEWQWRWPRNIFGFALASRRRGLVAHACGLRLANGAGILAPGCSGDGKSTLGRTLAGDPLLEATPLSDDRVAILAESDGRLRLAGTPWHSGAHLSSSAEAKLSLIAFPARGGDVPRVRSLSAHEAARRLMRCLGYPVWSRELMAWALELTSRIVAAAPAVEIAYTPAPDVGKALHVHLRAVMEDVVHA